MEVSPYLLIAITLLLLTVLFVAYKSHNNRVSPLQLLTADAFLPRSPDPGQEEEGFVSAQQTLAQNSRMGVEGFKTQPTDLVPGPESRNFESAFPVADGIGTELRPTYPTLKNPYMNVLNDEKTYNPTRPAAAPITAPMVKQSLDDFFRTNFYNDPTDVFGKQQDQRQFYTVPSTTIPNDRESLQNWLYNIYPKNCKAGGKSACYAGTDGGPIVSLNQYY
jgi:hypothetical protein